jgi:SAM-dependent methyltransferase/predicted  nucleic acid-binding Zn-ribbon protein
MSQLEDAIERFREHYVKGPDVASPSPFGRLATLYRRLLLRATLHLRVYYHDVHFALLDAVTKSGDASRAAMEPLRAEHDQLRPVLEGVQAETGELRAALEPLRGETDRLRAALEDLQRRLADAERRTDDADARAAMVTALNDELEQRTTRAEGQMAELARRTTEYGEETRKFIGHVTQTNANFDHRIRQIESTTDDLATSVMQTRAQTSELASVKDELTCEVHDLRDLVLRVERDAAFACAELTATPYLADYDAVHTLDEAGRPQLGFVGPLCACGSYASFEDTFRGSEDMIRERQRIYLSYLAGTTSVVDLGTGRGEMLDLLEEAGIYAVGVDLDRDMVKRARAKGRKVECVDALEFLERQPDGSLGAIFSAQFVEHLQPEVLMRLLRVARMKLRPGGVMITETVNPHSPRALKAFWVDLTHVHPLFPESLLLWHRLLGYIQARVLFPAGSGDLVEDLRTQGDFAIIAHNNDGVPANGSAVWAQG